MTQNMSLRSTERLVHPTCTNTRIRSVNDAHKIFYAVQQGVLRMVTRRLDTDERMQLRSGCVYAWEERGTHTEPNGLGIERFTEGRRWSPSRVRDEFLFYYEKYLPSFDCTNPHPPRDWDPLVKQTYSVWVETDRGRRKWHLTAYFTQATVDQLDSIDNMQVVRDFVVPESVFKSTRVTKSRDKNDTRKSSKFPDASTTSRWAPSPAPTLLTWPETSDQILMFQPYVYCNPANQVQTEVLGQQFLNPSLRSSNPINPTNFRDLDRHHTEAHPPSTYSRNPADNHRHDLREYNYMSQTVPVTDTTCSSASLSQTRPKGEQILPPHSVHTPATFLPANFSLSVTSDNTMHGYSSHDQFFPSTPSWEHVNSGSGNLNQRDGSANLAASATQTISSYLPFHNAINLDNEPESYQIMAPCLNPVHESPTRGNGTPRESLPSLITSTIMSPSFEAFSNKPSISATEPSQKFLGSDEGSLDLAPLSVLSRRRPYRREPADDEVLRQLPRSP
ncbi:hypothetical protein Ac2012v2_004596 [Leucoagaricus gongylophorus]